MLQINSESSQTSQRLLRFSKTKELKENIMAEREEVVLTNGSCIIVGLGYLDSYSPEDSIGRGISYLDSSR